jgi:cell division protein FtsB
MEFDLRKPVRQTVLLATLAATIIGGILAWRGRQLADMLDEQVRLDSQMLRLEQENRQARAERDALLSSPEDIERVAREDYGFAGPGERVSDFASPPPAPRPLPAVRVELPAWQRALMWPLLPLVLPVAVFGLTTFVLSRLESTSRARAGGVA